MEHPGFFKRAGPFTLADIAKATGAELVPGTASADTLLADVRTLTDAGPRDLTFFNNRKNADQLKATRAGALQGACHTRYFRPAFPIQPVSWSRPTPIAASPWR